MTFDLKSINFNPKKSLGQNFLIDENINRKILNIFNISPEDLILEIGPGYGALTKHIIGKTNNLIAIEIDKEITEYLKNNYQGLNILNKNFLEVNLDEIQQINKKKIRILGNIPYNITSPILFHIFDNKEYVKDALIMMQLDVAERIIAKPRTKDYGILSIFSQAYSNPKITLKISPDCFRPKPRIFSGMVHFDFHNNFTRLINNDKVFRNLVRTAFGKRRKVLRNSLKDLDNDLNKIDFDLSKRPEELTVEDFIKISNQLTAQAVA